jgi:hypothetical protein
VINCSRVWPVPSSLGGSASPEDDGERVAEGPNIRRRAVPRLRDQRVEDNTFHLALQRVDRLPGFRKKATGLAKALSPAERPATGGRAAKRLEIKDGNKVACPGDEVSDSLHRMPDFASFVCFVGQNSLEQASALIVHLFFDLVGSSAQAGRLFL